MSTTYVLQYRMDSDPWEDTTPRSGWTAENPETHKGGVFDKHLSAHAAFRDSVMHWQHLAHRVVRMAGGERDAVIALYAPYMNQGSDDAS